MRPEVLEAHLVPMRPESWRGFEPIVEHESLEPCHHSEPCKELQDDRQLKKLRKFEPGERTRDDLNPVEVIEERRVWRVAQMSKGESDWDGVSVGLPRHELPELGEALGPRAELSTDCHGPQGMRSCSRKLARAEAFGPRWHVRRTGARGSSSEVDYAALAEVMRGP